MKSLIVLENISIILLKNLKEIANFLEEIISFLKKS